MNTDNIIDYAMPMMRIEILLREMHDYLLDGHLDIAQDLSVNLITEAKLLCNTLILMKERQDALRKLTKAVQARVRTVRWYTCREEQTSRA